VSEDIRSVNTNCKVLDTERVIEYHNNDSVFTDIEINKYRSKIYDNYNFEAEGSLFAITTFLDNVECKIDDGDDRDYIIYFFHDYDRLLYSEKYIENKLIQRRVFNDSVYSLKKVYDVKNGYIDTLDAEVFYPECFPCE
jgi:hypothetical protein